MKKQNAIERLYLVAGGLALAGMGMVFSIVFAGPGVVVLAVAAALFLAGLTIQLVRPQPSKLVLAIRRRFRTTLGRTPAEPAGA
ncbi:MAG: hypothetical protein Q8O40_00900 [Chloroflexota bacterium]|nr:hypothetical protein [Chloroflexota bacterium]